MRASVFQAFLALVLLLSSAGGLVVEIVAGRLIAPYVGMSLYTWTAIIAVVLAGLSIGYWVGGRLAGSNVSDQSALSRLAVALGLAGVTCLLALALLRVLAPLLAEVGFGPVASVLLLCTALFFLPSLFVGIVAPIVTKLAVDLSDGDPGPAIGRMYAVGTLGSIGGTLAAGYLFISWIGSTWTVVAVAATYVILALGCMITAKRDGAALPIVVLLFVLAGVTAVNFKTEAFRTACTVESNYFCIRVDDFSKISGRESALMALDNLVHSINDGADPSLLYSPYVHFVDEYTRRHFFKRSDGKSMSAFFIGGGGFTLPRSWAETMNEATLVVAEIDPVVTEVATQRMWLDPSHKSIEIHNADARTVLALQPAEPRFDVIFGDAFHDISVPAHLVSREFNQEIKKRLRTRGFYVINVVDQANHPRFLAAMVNTLERDFPMVEIWADEEDLALFRSDPSARVTYGVVALDGYSPETRMTSLFGIDRRWRMIRGNGPLEDLIDEAEPLTDDLAPVDRLLSGLL